MTDRLADVATDAVTAGGTYLREVFRDGGTEADYTPTDVKAVADREAEQRVLGVIREAYPEHSISAEESGDHPGPGDVRWVVDALDGTNNFTAGIPTFGVAATALRDCEPVATAVHVPMGDELYVAERDGGVRYDGEPTSVEDGERVPPDHATVGTIIGPPVIHDEREAAEWDAVVSAVEGEVKRAIRSWAPVVHWGLLARGKLDGFVCFHPSEREQVAGELLAGEAGCLARGEAPLTVFGADEPTRDVLWDAAAGALRDPGHPTARER